MIFLDEPRLARVKRERDLSTSRWQRLIGTANQYLDVPLPYGGHAPNFSLAGLITGDSRYINKAINLAMQDCALGMVAIDYNHTGYGHFGGGRETVPRNALVLNWLGAYLTADQKATLQHWLVAWTDQAWPETQKPPLDNYGRGNPGDNFYHGFMVESALAGWALFESGHEAGLGYLQHVLRRWEEEALPHFARYQSAGIPLEGTSYGIQSMTHQAMLVDAFATCSPAGSANLNLWPEMAGLINQCLLQLTTPDLTRLTLMGDNAIWTPGRRPDGAWEPLMPLNDYVRAPALIAMNHVPKTGSPTSLRWMLDNWNHTPSLPKFDRNRLAGPLWAGSYIPGRGYEEAMAAGHSPGVFINPAPLDLSDTLLGQPHDGPLFTAPSPFHWLDWWMLFYDAELQEKGSGEREDLFERGNGVACSIAHTVPARAATQVYFQCSPRREAHQYPSGGFTIYKDGQYLLGHGGLWSGAQLIDSRATASHNTLLLAPAEQPEAAWGDDYQPIGMKRAQESVRLVRTVSAERYVYWQGSLGGAYARRNPEWHDDPELRTLYPLTNWQRDILWGRALDLFVVVDQIEKVSWAQQPKLAWHTPEQPIGSLTAGNWVMSTPHYKLAASLLSPGVNSFARYGNSWRNIVSPQQNPPNIYQVVHAFQVLHQSDVPRQVVSFKQNGALGATFGSGANAVTLAVQLADGGPPVTKRTYSLQQKDFADPTKYQTEAELMNAIHVALPTMRLSDHLFVTSREETTGGGVPPPPGALILIPKAALW